MSETIIEEAVTVDFPREREKIESAGYTIRVGAPRGAERVEVSIDEADWSPCRAAAGFWWYDWSGYAAGRHEAVCRAVMPGGETITSEPRSFRVALPTDTNGRMKLWPQQGQ